MKRRRFCHYRDETTSLFFAEAIKMAAFSLRPDLENEEGGRRRREKKKSKEISVFEAWSELRVRRRRVDDQPTSGYGDRASGDGEPTTQRGKLGFAFLNFGRVCCVYS